MLITCFGCCYISPRACLLILSSTYPLLGLPHQGQDLELEERQPRAWGGHDSSRDVFCMVKQTMSCPHLCQPPLLVWPAALEPQSRQLFDVCNRPDCPTLGCTLKEERVEELRLLRDAIARDFPHMQRTVRWYSGMIDRSQGRTTPAFLSFLRHNTAHDLDDFNHQLGERPVPPKPHELQVVFHRARF